MILKSLRVFAATLFFGAILFFFLDFTKTMPTDWHRLLHVQIVPALVAASFGILAVWVVLTLLFGRIYCSVVCPLGVMQDLFSRLGRRQAGSRRPGSKKSKRKFRYEKPFHFLRYGVLLLTIAALLLGLSIVPTFVDPYSIFGRIVNSTIRPLYLLGDNFLASIPSIRSSLGLYFVTVPFQATSFLLSLGMFGLLGFLAFRYGRRYCNTFCPVGTLLGLFSWFSVFRIRLRSDCIGCGLCEQNCKGECIDSKEKRVDASRCVACFNCLSACKRGSLSYSTALRPLPENVQAESRFAANGNGGTVHNFLTWTETQAECPPDAKGTDTPPVRSVPRPEGRRRLLILAAWSGLISMFGLSKLFAETKPTSAPHDAPPKTPGGLPKGTSRVGYKKTHAIMPPGAVEETQFHRRCTACHACVAKCPDNVLVPAVSEYGLAGFLQPTLQFQYGFCNFDCTTCSEVCPNHALQRITKEEKHQLQMGQVVFLKENCVVHTQGTNCGACAEHCPTGAVTMIPHGDPKDALTIPAIKPEFCVGCGACEHICPVLPFRAIYVEGNGKHLEAKLPYDPNEKQKEIKVDDFGF